MRMPEKSRIITVRRVSGNVLKGISFVVLLACGAVFGSDVLENGTLPPIAIFGLAVAAFLFWVGGKLNSA
jgi:hypothetical protein